MSTFTKLLQTTALLVLFAFSAVQKANASIKAGEASVYEGSTVKIELANAYERTLRQSTGVTYQWYSRETLAPIALKYNIPKRKSLEYNGIVMEANLNEGDVVFLAKKKTKYEGAQDFYRVKEGESFTTTTVFWN